MASGYLNWHKTLAEVHNLSAMAGAQYNYTQYKYTFVSVKDINPSLEIPNGAGEVLIKDGDSKPAKWHEAMMSYFGRLNYDYKQRYLTMQANIYLRLMFVMMVLQNSVLKIVGNSFGEYPVAGA
jgi:hypothetical protein